MSKVLSAIGTKRNGNIEFMMTDEEHNADFYIFEMSPDDAIRLSNKLIEAAYKARLGWECHDISGNERPAKKQKHAKFTKGVMEKVPQTFI